ncbi:hypothetical protein [Acidianus brierleyi]|uniref:Uncharacterized protein n=1 Tax=Acidianus brierleyi TaxID=41673 RepID=A0A2U9IBS3_9CREN|nr:hypothetical protein [Acidianus brierleyi]AWR93458.1 hypothetical protein DFR85_01370 [Acidianus brierleyi]
MARVNIAADAELIKELEKEVKSRGYTIFAVTNIALKAILELLKSGEDSTTLQNLVEMYKITKDLDIIPIPSWYIENLVKLAYEKDSKSFQDICDGTGEQLSSYLKSRASSFEDLLNLYSEIRGVLPIKDINVKKGSGDSIDIRLTGTGFNIESTLCAGRVFKKILEAYSFEVIEMTTSPGGIIFVKAKYSRPT